MQKHKIIVIGSSNTDMVIQSGHLPVPGETVLGGVFTMHPGGKGANQAVAAARLGGEVSFVARVGNDLFGQQAIEGFKKHGIDTQFVRKDEKNASGIALIMVDEKGENCISVALGANDAMEVAHLSALEPHLKQDTFVLLQLETPMSIVAHIANLAKKIGFRMILNPAPASALSDEILSALYLISPNTIEAELLSGIRVEDKASARKAARILKDKGVANVIITMGSQGAYVLSEELDELVPSQKVKVVDTTAAGDTFNGALVVALSEGKNLKEAVIFANRAAAYSVGILGAQTSAPKRSDIEPLS